MQPSTLGYGTRRCLHQGCKRKITTTTIYGFWKSMAFINLAKNPSDLTYVSVNLARIPHDASLVQVSKTRMHGWWRSGAISWNSCVHSTSKPMPLFSFVPGDVETPMGTRWSCLYGRCSILPSDTIQQSTDFMCEKGKLAWYTMVNNFACN
jgi:hypothetical protein